MQAAVIALRQLEPARIVVAVPVGARETCARIGRLADEVVCVAMPEPFQAVGLWYEQFAQTTDDEVKQLLAGQAESPPSPFSVMRERALPLAGGANDYDALLEGIGDARIVMIGEATSRHARVLSGARAHHAAADPEKGFTGGRGRSRLARRVSRQPVCSRRRDRRGRGRRPGRLRPVPDVDVAQRRRARLRRLAARAQRHPACRSSRRLLRPRSVQPPRVDSGGARVSRQGRSGGRPPRTRCDMRASISSATRCRRTATRRHSD